MAARFVSGYRPPGPDPLPGWWFAFRNRRMLLAATSAEAAPALPTAADLQRWQITADTRHYLGRYGDRPCYALDLPKSLEAPPGAALIPLRDLYLRLPEDLASLCGRAAQILDWDRDHRFCGRCGAPTQPSREERAKQCPHCGQIDYPILAPAVIVLVEDRERILLARSPRFPPGMYSVLAGFVEPGETLEETVAREIYEEVHLEVTDLRYFGSQPWPFPHSLMLAFTARYAGGDLTIDGKEIEDAGWFTADRLPLVPNHGSIARRLIDWFVDRRRQGDGHEDP